MQGKPRQAVIPVEPKRSNKENQIISALVRDAIRDGTISLAHPSKDQFISNIFVVPKPDKSYRLIINLKKFNEFVKVSHFKIEDQKTVARLLTPDCFMATIDLKNAYYLVPIRKSDRKYLRFRFNNCLFEYNCLPFGLSCAPWMFTKIMKPVMALLRKEGFLSVIYLDDILIFGHSKQDCETNLRKTLELLEHLGFMINFEKSCFLPNQICKYLGFLYNSENMSISLPYEKRLKILKLLKKFSTTKRCTIRDFSKFIGTLVSSAPAIKYAFLYTKLFEREKSLALSKSGGNYEAKMCLPPSLSLDFSWWLNAILKADNTLRTDKFQSQIYTDASRSGWGAYFNNQTTSGFWSLEEGKLHINELELLAVFFGLKSFLSKFSNCNVLCRIDNTTAVCTVNRMGSVKYKNLNNLARIIWTWCQQRNMYIFASYITSKSNIHADRASRTTHKETEWSLANYAFKKITETFGVLDIDLFASRINTKCHKFVSWMRDPEAYEIDAFTLNWNSFHFYAFPPFSIISRVLQKIITDKAEGIVVVPLWTSQPWFPLFQALLVNTPITFEPNNRLLSFSGTPHPLSESLSLVAGKLSGKHYYREKCQNSP